MRWAMINKDTNIVYNVCEWDGTDRWTPPENTLMVQSLVANKNDKYDPETQTFSKSV